MQNNVNSSFRNVLQNYTFIHATAAEKQVPNLADVGQTFLHVVLCAEGSGYVGVSVQGGLVKWA